jgi:predicted unusual protein kinase regulating ubiquinone biosynthesis (AarF/ABC1/UbiB family)
MNSDQPVAQTSVWQNGRYRRILLFFGTVILHVLWWDLLLGRLPLLKQWPQASRPRRYRYWSRRFRQLAVEMGGVMIKLGQFLSARVDVLPAEITEELKGLQDEVPAEDSTRMFTVLRQELGNLDDHFARVEERPLAAASLGQAHRAWLRPTTPGATLGEPVVVKIQRPGIERLVQTDLSALSVVARWVMGYGPIRRRANVPQLLEEFAKTLWEELDYEAEAGNADRFAEMYANDGRVYIPAVYRQHSTRRVIVLEDVEAIKITDVAGMKEASISPQEVAEALLDAYFRQVFRENFFHADPHPGNLFVRPRTDLPWQPEQGPRPFWLIFVDFGMVGRVPNLVGQNLRRVIISVVQRDAEQLTAAYDDLGFFLPGADLERISEAQTAVLDRIWGRDLLDLASPDPQEVQELGQEFRDLLFEFPFQVPQDFIYLGRAMGMISGLVSQLDPEINPWYQLERYGEALLASEVSEEFSVETLLALIRPYLDTPHQVHQVVEQALSGRLRVRTEYDRETMRQLIRLEKRLQQLYWSILGAAGLISATLLYLLRKR